MQRLLMTLGIVILLAGLLWPVLIKLPFGRLPGDIIIDKPNFKIYIPITTVLLISIFLSIVFWIFKK
ncbi:MAG: DUF2905 domain-containing protein [Ignavibacteriaceae bacterium]